MITKNFPTADDKMRLAEIKKLSLLLDNDQYPVFGLSKWVMKHFQETNDVLYLSHSIPDKIADFFGDFVQGDIDAMIIESSDESQKEAVEKVVYWNDLKSMIYDIAYEQSGYGYSVLLGRKDDEGNFVIDKIPQDQTFLASDGSVVFGSYIIKPNSVDGKDMWLYTQRYFMKDKIANVERKLYDTDLEGIATEEVGLALYDETLKPNENLEIDELPIAIVQNSRRKKKGFAKSDLVDVLPQIDEINERGTQEAIQFLKNLDAKLVLPTSMEDDDGKIPPFEFVTTEKEDVEPKYLINTNPMMTEIRNHCDKELSYISWITSVPIFELLSGGIPERVESLRIKLFQAVRKTNSKRAEVKKGIETMLRVALKFEKVTEIKPFKISFSEVLPSDPLVDVQVEALKLTSGISSKKSAIKRIENIDDDTADAELALIEQENKIAGIGDKNIGI